MTVEALRRRRPETLADLLASYGRELQAVAYLILRDRERPRMSSSRRSSPPSNAVGRSATSARSGLGSFARDQPGAREPAQDRPADPARSHPGTRRPGRPGDLATEASTRIALLDGIADLPLQIRAAIVLRYYADLSVEEVAATLGKSPNTIKAQLQTALDRLRVHLADPVGASLEEASHA